MGPLQHETYGQQTAKAEAKPAQRQPDNDPGTTTPAEGGQPPPAKAVIHPVVHDPQKLREVNLGFIKKQCDANLERYLARTLTQGNLKQWNTWITKAKNMNLTEEEKQYLGRAEHHSIDPPAIGTPTPSQQKSTDLVQSVDFSQLSIRELRQR